MRFYQGASWYHDYELSAVGLYQTYTAWITRNGLGNGNQSQSIAAFARRLLCKPLCQVSPILLGYTYLPNRDRHDWPPYSMGASSIGLLETPSLQALFGCEVLYIDVFDTGHTTHHHPVCCSYIKVLHFHFYKAQLYHAITSVQHIEQSFTNPFSSSMTLLRRACQDPALPPQSDMAPHLMDSKGFILRESES